MLDARAIGWLAILFIGAWCGVGAVITFVSLLLEQRDRDRHQHGDIGIVIPIASAREARARRRRAGQGMGPGTRGRWAR